MYSELLEHIKQYTHHLQHTYEKWKQDLLKALSVCKSKLHTYSEGSKADNKTIYNLATILDPACKLMKYKAKSVSEQNEKQWF